MWWVGMRARGLLLASGGGIGAGYRDLGLGARDSRPGVIWIQGHLRPREQVPSFPLPPRFLSRGSRLWSGVGSKGQTGAGRGARTWVKEEGTSGPLFSTRRWTLEEWQWWCFECGVCTCVCVGGEEVQTLNPLSLYYLPGTLLAPWNHPARR